ncbi:MAG: type II secretion system protein [Desulfosarcina sp.]|nr:type II secretion system protein [Desulfosarcina sp.]MBC2741944.1 type II secretion system protein [Desulfosarcina sp.]MBC2764857.1 type II secretion system protein [Desulfosarcina sp.]
MNLTLSKESGFTLIEIIVTLTVAAILSVMLVQFIGTSITRSAEPTLSIQEGMALQGVFENMNAGYKQLLLTGISPLNTFKTRVDSGFYGTYTVTESDYIIFDNNQIEAPCDTTNTDCKILKVTISMGDHSLTSLFAR